RADIALWRLDALQYDAVDDPVAALVLGGTTPPLELLLVDGRPIVERAELRTVDVAAAAANVRAARRRLGEGS
ncbi:MAG TPA: 8-oxoguanine deaminase, partial [Streptosporangiaceae bacterium]|nr:8-oxoguanine deaminase [Streptosporangiaceae bacterium]